MCLYIQYIQIPRWILSVIIIKTKKVHKEPRCFYFFVVVILFLLLFALDFLFTSLLDLLFARVPLQPVCGDSPLARFGYNIFMCLLFTQKHLYGSSGKKIASHGHGYMHSYLFRERETPSIYYCSSAPCVIWLRLFSVVEEQKTNAYVYLLSFMISWNTTQLISTTTKWLLLFIARSLSVCACARAHRTFCIVSAIYLSSRARSCNQTKRERETETYQMLHLIIIQITKQATTFNNTTQPKRECAFPSLASHKSIVLLPLLWFVCWNGLL